jgi:hypothetical protein
MAKAVIRAAPTMNSGSLWEIRSLKVDFDNVRLIGLVSHVSFARLIFGPVNTARGPVPGPAVDVRKYPYHFSG